LHGGSMHLVRLKYRCMPNQSDYLDHLFMSAT